jgi:hypothetical protein
MRRRDDFRACNTASNKNKIGGRVGDDGVRSSSDMCILAFEGASGVV